jgi:hypothetical protein
MPKPTAETIDSNKLGDEEGKNTPDVFVRKETVSWGLSHLPLSEPRAVRL